MANTLDIMLSGFIDKEDIVRLNEFYKLDLKKVSYSNLSSGPKNVIFDSYAQCYRSSNATYRKGIIQLMKDMHSGDNFLNPQTVLIVNDDDDCNLDSITINQRGDYYDK